MDNQMVELQLLMKQKQSEAFYAEKMGLTVERIRELKARIKEIEDREGTMEIDGSSLSEIKFDFDRGEVKCSGLYEKPMTPEEIVKLHNIDVAQYKLSSFWSIQREGGWRVSALFTKIAPQERALSRFEDFLASYKAPQEPSLDGVAMFNDNFKGRPSCAVLSLTDFHLDKKDITEASFEEKAYIFKQALQNLVMRAYHSSYLEEMVFVIGNDFFQTDTLAGTTTGGTPVDSVSCWDKAYEFGFDLLVNAVVYLQSFCAHLRVVLVPGNHSRTKEFYLAHALAKYFEKNPNVSFDRSSDNLKIHAYGETLLCFHHGDCINDKLPLAFATTFYKEWGESKYKEILLGDKHHNVQKIVKNQGEEMGVRMRILPSLTGTDAWHQKNLFINSIQAGVILIYDKVMGKCAEFEERVNLQ